MRLRKHDPIELELGRHATKDPDMEYYVSIARDTPHGRKFVFTDPVGVYVIRTTEGARNVYTFKLDALPVPPGDYVLVTSSRRFDRSTPWQSTELALSVTPAAENREFLDP